MPQDHTLAARVPRPGLPSAPAVRFPVARSALPLAALSGFALLALPVIACVAWQGRGLSMFQWAFFAAAWLGSVFAALRAWRRLPAAGWLEWNGAEWLLHHEHGTPQACAAQALNVAVDFQKALLLQGSFETKCGGWLWLERRQAPDAWLALRRALYVQAAASAGRNVAPADASMLPAHARHNNNDD